MTVSPVINRYGYASQEARARVERAVAELPVDVIVRRSSAPAPLDLDARPGRAAELTPAPARVTALDSPSVGTEPASAAAPTAGDGLGG